MSQEIQQYIDAQTDQFRTACERLFKEILEGLPEAEYKIWHGHPVWFLGGNPILGFSVQKPGVRLMFWSGADFEEPGLRPGTGKFKDASVFYQSVDQVDTQDIKRWLEKSKRIQWDYKNLVKHKGKLEKLST